MRSRNGIYNTLKIGSSMGILLLLVFLLVPRKIISQQSHVNIDWAPQKNLEDLVPLSANIISPEVLDDHTVIFRLKAPNASKVELSGSMFVAQDSPKSMPFVKGDDGIWTLKIGPLEPNIYLYSFLIDGVRTIDPNNTYTGHANMPAFSMVYVHGEGPAFYDAKDVPHGVVSWHVYHSEVTKGERQLLVYTPPGYDTSKEYPVLYLMGGSGDLAETWFMHGQLNFIMDNLLAEGKALPMVIAMPNNHVLHRMHPEHSTKTFPILEEEFKKAIIPFVEENYSIKKDRHSRAISGLSMGGRHAQYVGINNLDIFANVGLLSAALPVDMTPDLDDPSINSKLDYFFVGAGPHETYPGVRHEVLHQELQKRNVEHEYYIGSKGGHDLVTWRHLLYYRFLPNLWRK